MSQTERALEAEQAEGVAVDDAAEEPADSTAEIIAEVDGALEEYVASVEEYTGRSDPFSAPPDVPPGFDEAADADDASHAGNGSGEPNDSHGSNATNGSNGGGADAHQPHHGAGGTNGNGVATVDPDDAGFFVVPEVIAPDDEVTVADLADTTRTEWVPKGWREGETAPVDDRVLEELRRADIDGPLVEAAPHDDVSAARRRPKRGLEYDPAPIPIPAKPPRLLGRKPRVRKVTRVVRHVDPWTVFKVAIVANLVLYVILLVAGVLLWNVANATGTVDNVERFFESFGWASFEFNGGQIYHSAWIAGLFMVIGLTGLAVLLATLFNLITDLVGGLRFTVLEEEVVERRTSPMRRFVVRRPEPEVPATFQDETGPIIREAVVDDSGSIEKPSW